MRPEGGTCLEKGYEGYEGKAFVVRKGVGMQNSAGGCRPEASRGVCAFHQE